MTFSWNKIRVFLSFLSWKLFLLITKSLQLLFCGYVVIKCLQYWHFAFEQTHLHNLHSPALGQENNIESTMYYILPVLLCWLRAGEFQLSGKYLNFIFNNHSLLVSWLCTNGKLIIILLLLVYSYWNFSALCFFLFCSKAVLQF